MTTAMMPPEDEDKDRILKWSKFYNPKSIEHLPLEEQFKLHQILRDVQKPFSQAEELQQPSSEANRQIISDLYRFTKEVLTSFYVQHHGEKSILRKLTEDSLQSSLDSAMEFYKREETNDDGEE